MVVSEYFLKHDSSTISRITDKKKITDKKNKQTNNRIKSNFWFGNEPGSPWLISPPVSISLFNCRFHSLSLPRGPHSFH